MSIVAQNHTFVVPAYKNSPYLEDCIISLKNQILPTNILIATSTPSSYIEDIAIRNGIPYFVSTNPPSIGGDWNFALSCTQSRYVTIAHQDDIYHPLYTTEILNGFKKADQKNPLMAFTDYADVVNGIDRKGSLNSFVKNSLLWSFKLKHIISNRFFKKASLSLGNSICCPSVTLDRLNTGDFRFSETITCVLDWVAWMQLAKRKGAFIYINKKLVKHRIHVDSETTNQIKLGKRYQEELEVLSSVWGKRIAKLIAGLYIKGHNENAI